MAKETKRVANLYSQGYCAEYIKKLSKAKLWKILTEKLLSMQKDPCFNSEEEKNENSEEAMSKYKNQIDVMIRDKECVEEIKNLCKKKRACLAMVQSRLRVANYKDPCVEKDIEMQIVGIGINTKQDQLGVIKKLADRFALTKELFEKRYEAIRKQIKEAINKINLSTNKNTLLALDEQAKNYGLGENIAIDKFNQVQEVISKIAALDENTSEEVRQIVEVKTIQQNLTEKYDARVNSIKTDIKTKIGQLKIDDDKIYIESIKRYASNYGLQEEFDKEYKELQKEVITKIETLRIDTDENVTDMLNRSSTNFNLFDQFSIKYSMIQRANKIQKSVPISDANFNYNTTLRSHECFKALKLEQINLCVKCDLDKKVFSSESENKPKKKGDVIPVIWDIEIDGCLPSLSNFIKICLKEFNTAGFVNCKTGDIKEVSGDIKDLDINYQTTANFSSDICFEKFDKQSKKICFHDRQVTSFELANKYGCLAQPSWIIERTNCIQEKEVMGICEQEFTLKEFLVCDT